MPPAPPVVEAAPEPVAAKKVLLASGNAEIIRQAREALELVGIETLSVSDAAAVQDHIKSQRNEISLVVIDFMPGQALGHGALRAALGSWPKVPVVVIADESDLGAAERLTLTSAVTFIPRPLHPLALIQRVRQLATATGT